MLDLVFESTIAIDQAAFATWAARVGFGGGHRVELRSVAGS